MLCANHPFELEIMGATREPGLSARQRSIANELALYNANWAGLFEAGVALLSTVTRPGNAYLLAHAGRELTRAVVHRLIYRLYQSVRIRDNTAIPRIRESLTLMVGDRDAEDVAPDCERREAFRDDIAAALELAREHPIVDTWFRVYNRLTGYAHVNSIPGGRSPDPSAVAAAFDEMTDLIYGRLAPYFDTQHELDAFLAIQQPTDGDVVRLRSFMERPAQRTYFFHRLAWPGWLAKLRDAGLLSAPGASFAETADGRLLWRQWPEGGFVVRMAGELPEEVTTFIRSVPPTSQNPLLWRTVLQAASVLPVTSSRDLVPKIRTALNAGHIRGTADLIVQFALALARGGESSQARNLICDLLVVELDDANSPYLRGRVHFSRIDHHDVWLLQHELFPALEKADRVGLLKWAAYMLRNQLRVALPERSSEVAPTESSAGSIQANGAVPTGKTDGLSRVGDLGESLDGSYGLLHGRDLLSTDIEDAEPIPMMARLVARTAVALAREGEDGVRKALYILLPHTATVFRRIKLLVLAEAGAAHTEEIGVTLDRISDDECARVFWPQEVAIFLRGAWVHAPLGARERFAAALRSSDHAAIRERLIKFHGTEPTDADVDERVRGDQRTVLALFGSEVPAELIDIARDASHDSSASGADRLSRNYIDITTHSRTGPVSPRTDEEIDALGSNGVLQFLREWRPTDDEWESPSIDGLSYAIMRYVSRDVARAQPLIDAAASLDEPSYVRGILAGLVRAAQEGEAIPWPDALGVAQRVAAERDSDLPPERPQRADQSWRQAKGVALELIDAAAERDAIPDALLPAAWAVIDATFENPDTAEPPRRYATGPSHGAQLIDNQLVVALGTLAVAATVAAVRLAVSSARLTGAARYVASGAGAFEAADQEIGAGFNAPAPTESERQVVATPLVVRLARWLSSDQPWVPSVQVAVGESLPLIVWLDRAWVAHTHNSLFEGGYGHPEANPTWSAFIVRNGPGSVAFEVLRESYVRAARALPRVTTDSDRTRKWHPESALVSHVITLVLHGFAHTGDPDHLVETVLNRAEGADLVLFYGNIARAMRADATNFDTATAERLATFWTWRLDELERMSPGPRRDREAEGLGWFFKVDGIPSNVALSLLKRTVVIAGRLGGVVSTWWPKLADLVSSCPGEVVEVTRLILERHVRDDFYRVRINEATAIIRTGLSDGDVGTRRSAARLADMLGERGYYEMLLLLEEAGMSPTQADST